MDTPSERLATRIIERLIAEGLVAPADGKKLQAKLANGKLRPRIGGCRSKLPPIRR